MRDDKVGSTKKFGHDEYMRGRLVGGGSSLKMTKGRKGRNDDEIDWKISNRIK